MTYKCCRLNRSLLRRYPKIELSKNTSDRGSDYAIQVTQCSLQKFLILIFIGCAFFLNFALCPTFQASQAVLAKLKVQVGQ